MRAVTQRPVHEQVAAIVAAAEAAAEKLRVESELRMHARIAEGERAAENRVEAAEAEARDIVQWAREEAARLRDEAHAEAEHARTDAAGEALQIVARAQDQAEIFRAEAQEAKTQATSEALQIVAHAQETAARATGEADAKARELLAGARDTATEIQTKGAELVENLRQMGDSLRANSTRLLRDVQLVHRQMLAQIEAAGGDVGGLGPITAARVREPPRRPPVFDGELEVPEYVPRG
jgi:cell division septum initiation protein DivIVA